MIGLPADHVKSCCAATYGSDVVALLLGDSYHPGGLALTRRLAELLDIGPGRTVLDVACGRGASALLLARERQARVSGVDLSAANIALAQGAAAAAGFSDTTQFRTADAENLPYPGGTFDAVICECAWCTFPEKAVAASEFARMLAPGGKLGITDITARPDRLPPELTGLAAWVACIADARPLEQYEQLLTDAGLTVTRTETHPGAVTRMIDQIAARLELVRMTARDRAEQLGIDFARTKPILAAARSAVASGHLGYALLTARKDHADQ